ncbi:type II CAAX endopeptidase family protein [Lignipirellula cremea]|uniref:CAAX amino terminal protease self-immunity n=1 Tax=Lignipirellula cremea TaxID=2528010 RepID=A0A518E275_9BACT|nr:type II CAAX endopeptidase family protein [Lignipirellula cremea]QDU98174.1 CAAX amino terminal protease self- immunity [Lignipirellula cremea]
MSFVDPPRGGEDQPAESEYVLASDYRPDMFVGSDGNETPPGINWSLSGKLWAGVSWGVILVIVGLFLFSPYRRAANLDPLEEAAEEAPESPHSTPDSVVFELQAKYLVGAGQLPGISKEELFQEGRRLFNSGPMDRRFRFITLTGEMAGPTAALEELSSLQELLKKHQHRLTEQEQETFDLLRRAYTDYSQQEWTAPSLSATDKQKLETRLGWFGRLALAPDQSLPSEELDPELSNALEAATETSGGIAGSQDVDRDSPPEPVYDSPPEPTSAGSSEVKEDSQPESAEESVPPADVENPDENEAAAEVDVTEEFDAPPEPARTPAEQSEESAEDAAAAAPVVTTPGRSTLLGEAMRIMALILSVGMLGLAIGFLGLIGGGVFMALIVKRRLKSRVDAGSPHGGVYAETFALWLVLFLVLGMAASLIESGSWGLALQALVFFGSLSVLIWPLIRGVSWNTLVRDIGWTRPVSYWDPVLGVICHICSVPLLLTGLLGTMIVFQLVGMTAGEAAGDPFAPISSPAHPAVQWMADAGLWGKLQIALLACVAAPIVEETMFRGVLYRHLRDATAGWRITASVTFAAILNGLVFAAIHPQGIIAIPILGAIAVGFSLMREWRGSLVTSMAAHAFNNSMVMGMLFFLL